MRGIGVVVAAMAALGMIVSPPSAWCAWGSRAVVACPEPGDQRYIQVVNGHQDDIFVVWRDTRPEAGEPTPAHIYAIRISSSGEVANGWPTSGLRLDFATMISNPASAAPDGRGGLFVCWSDIVVGTGGALQRLRLCRVSADGAVLTGTPEGGLPLGPPERSSESPAAMLDRDGGLLIAATFSIPGSNGGIVVSKHDSIGATWPGWPDSGVVLCDQPGTQSFPKLVPAPTGGALVVWIDNRNSQDLALYGHRIRSDGTLDPTWTSQGRRLIARPAVFADLLAIPDGAGGMIVSYGDSLGAVDSTGAIRAGWPPAGVRGEPEPPRIASDGSPGAYVLSQRVVRRYSQTLYTRGAVLGRYDLSGAPSPGWPDTGRVIYESVLGYGQYPQELLASPQGVYAIWGDAGEPRGVRGLRLTPDGQVAPGWPSTPPVVTTRGFSGYPSTLLPSGDAVIAWSGTIYDGGNTSTEDTLFVQRLGVDGPVPTLASVASAGVAGDLATIEWWVVDAPPTPLRVERSGDGAAWEPAGLAEAVGGDRVRFREPGLRPGERRAYRLTWMESGAPRTAGLVWVERRATEELRVVSGRFANGPERIVLGLSLPTADPLRVQVLDVQGRVLLEQRIVPRDAGEQTVELAPRQWTPGLYLVRVTPAGDEARSRVVVIR